MSIVGDLSLVKRVLEEEYLRRERLLYLLYTVSVLPIISRVSGDIRYQVWKPLLFYYPCELM